MAEYNALPIGLQLAKQMGVTYLEAYGDSKLIVNQIKWEDEVRHEDLISYHHVVIKLANTFDGFYISHISRFQNTKANALAALVATLALPADTSYQLTVATHYLFCLKHSIKVKEVYTISTTFESRDWQFPIIDYALDGILPNDPKQTTFIWQRFPHFYYDPEVKTLYRRSYDGVLLRYLSKLEAPEVLKKVHDGICGTHQPGLKLKDRLHMLDCYWLIPDTVQYAKWWKAC